MVAIDSFICQILSQCQQTLPLPHLIPPVEPPAVPADAEVLGRTGPGRGGQQGGRGRGRAGGGGGRPGLGGGVRPVEGGRHAGRGGAGGGAGGRLGTHKE